MSDVAIAVLALVATACIAAWRWPLVGLLTYLWLDFMRPHDTYVELRGVRPMLVVGLVTVAVTVWRARRQLAAAWRPLLPVVTLTAVVAASAAVSVDRLQTAATLAQLGKLVVLVWLFEQLVRSERSVRAVLWVVVLSLSVLAIGAIVQAGEHGLWRGFSYEQVIEGPRGLGDGALRDSNDLARALTLAAPLAWGLAALPGRGWLRIAAGAALLLCLAAIEATFSRGGFVALLVGAGAIASALRPLWRGTALWLAFTIAVLACSPRAYVDRITTIVAARGDAAVQGRVDVWRAAWQIVERRPLLGQGAGTFRSDDQGTPDVRRPSHNILIELGVEIGLAGLAAYGWVLLDTLLRLHRVRRRAASAAWARTTALATGAALLAYLTAGLFLSGPFNAPLFVLVGLSLALEHGDRSDALTAVPSPVSAANGGGPGRGPTTGVSSGPPP